MPDTGDPQETPTAPAEAPTPSDPPAPTPGETPPWGEDFDPERAWKTIQTQREAERKMKAELDAFRKAQTEREDAEKTEIQRLQDRLAKAEAEAKTAAHERLVAKIAREFGVPDDLLEFLVGDDEEALTAKAKRLAEFTAPTSPPPAVPGKPKPRLTPGDRQAPPDDGEDDVEAIVARIRKRDEL